MFQETFAYSGLQVVVFLNRANFQCLMLKKKIIFPNVFCFKMGKSLLLTSDIITGILNIITPNHLTF